MNDKIEEVIERINPILELHGGNVELRRFDKRSKTVHVEFVGACSHCAISSITLENLIKKEILKSCPGVKNVVAVAS